MLLMSAFSKVTLPILAASVLFSTNGCGSSKSKVLLIPKMTPLDGSGYFLKAVSALDTAVGKKFLRKPDCTIALLYLTNEEAQQPIVAKGMATEVVTRCPMAFAADPPTTGYFTELEGIKDSNPVSVTVGGISVPVSDWPDPTPPPYYWPTQDELAKRAASVVPASSSQQAYPDSCIKFTTGDMTSRQVNFTPVPVYEADFFDGGKWKGSYCVWTNEADAKSSSFKATP